MITYDLPAPDYHAIDALSASGAKLLLKSPAHYLAAKEHQRDPTPAMAFGSLVHSLVLEPDTVDALYIAAPKFDKRTTAGKAAAEKFDATAGGRTVVDMDLFQKAQRVGDSVRSHHRYSELLKGAKIEASMFWDQHGVPCKARADALNGSSIIDIKTTRDASPDAFARSVATFQYHLQAAHYLDGYSIASGFMAERFVFLAVETEAPFAVGVYVLDAASIAGGAEMMSQAGRAYRIAQNSTAWKGYSPDIVEIAVPRYAMPVEMG